MLGTVQRSDAIYIYDFWVTPNVNMGMGNIGSDLPCGALVATPVAAGRVLKW